MGLCPDCCRPQAKSPKESADSPETPWCECPALKVEPYKYSEEDDPEEVT